MAEINAQDRFDTYRKELKAMDIPFDRSIVYRGDWSIESGYDAFRTLHGRKTGATAVFFSNDEMALGAIRAAYESNVLIPEDISISGYDDTKHALFAVPALTTVRQPLDGLAAATADLIVNRLTGAPGPRKVVLEPELKIRASCRRIR